MRHKTLASWSVALGLMAGAPAAIAQDAQPSFDCAGARTRVEHMICGNPRLAARDRAEGDRFIAAMAGADPEQTDKARRDQRSWLKTRNACTTVKCVAASYDYRMNQLGGS